MEGIQNSRFRFSPEDLVDWDPTNDSQTIESLKNRIIAGKEIPGNEILEYLGVNFERQVGPNLFALCPYHMDQSLGSYSYNVNMNIDKCFACNHGGNPIQSAMRIKNWTEQEAILKIASKFKLITKETYQQLMAQDWNPEDDRDGATHFKATTRKVKKKTATEKIRNHLIYNLIAMYFGLTTEDREYLLRERKIPEERLNSYFSFVFTKKKTKKGLIKTIQKVYPEYMDHLESVPGFYFDLENNSLELNNSKGIGILITDAEGFVRGIQIRRYNIKKGEMRYIWFGSAWAQSSKLCRGGGNVGSPQDVVYPKCELDKKKPLNVSIVEGRFKAEILAQQKNVAVSVQGVGNYAGIEHELQDIETKYGRTIDNIHIFYDADMIENWAVFKQALKLGYYLNEKRPDLKVSFACWKEEYGKGIDDMIFAGHKYDVKLIPQKKLENIWSENEKLIIEKYNITSVTSISKEERSKIISEMKGLLEKQMFS